MIRRRALVAAAGTVLVAAAGVSWWTHRKPVPSSVRAAPTVAVSPRAPLRWEPRRGTPHSPVASRVYRPYVRTDIVSIAGQDEPVPRAAAPAVEPSAGKPALVERSDPGPSDEELRGDQQRRRALQEAGIDAPNPRIERPNAPRTERPGPK